MHVCQFLPPFCALLEELHIDAYDSVFLPLPLYHGFGLATLVVSFLMGKKVCLMNRFDAAEALMMISDGDACQTVAGGWRCPLDEVGEMYHLWR